MMNMEVDKVADEVAEMVVDMDVDKVADEVAEHKGTILLFLDPVQN